MYHDSISSCFYDGYVRIKAREGRMHANQHIILTGLGAKSFEMAVNAIRALAQGIPDQVGINNPIIWDADIVHDMFPGVRLETRYLSRMQDYRPSEVFEPPRIIDPLGYLADAINGEFVFTDDNCVQYFEKEEGTNHDIKYVQPYNSNVVLNFFFYLYVFPFLPD
jgi:hypothetical protein